MPRLPLLMLLALAVPACKYVPPPAPTTPAAKPKIDNLNLGGAALQKGDNDLAISYLSEAIRQEPENDMAYRDRAVAHANKGDLDKAIADFTEAIRINSKESDHYAGRGAAYLRKKDYPRAIKDYEQAVKVNPKHAIANYHLALLYETHFDDHDMAMAYCDRVLSIAPKHSGAHLLRGQIYLGRKSYKDAFAACSLAVTNNPKSANAWLFRGMSRYLLGDKEKGLADMRTAIKYEPDMSRAVNEFLKEQGAEPLD